MGERQMPLLTTLRIGQLVEHLLVLLLGPLLLLSQQSFLGLLLLRVLYGLFRPARSLVWRLEHVLHPVERCYLVDRVPQAGCLSTAKSEVYGVNEDVLDALGDFFMLLLELEQFVRDLLSALLVSSRDRRCGSSLPDFCHFLIVTSCLFVLNDLFVWCGLGCLVVSTSALFVLITRLAVNQTVHVRDGLVLGLFFPRAARSIVDQRALGGLFYPRCSRLLLFRLVRLTVDCFVINLLLRLRLVYFRLNTAEARAQGRRLFLGLNSLSLLDVCLCDFAVLLDHVLQPGVDVDDQVRVSSFVSFGLGFLVCFALALGVVIEDASRVALDNGGWLAFLRFVDDVGSCRVSRLPLVAVPLSVGIRAVRTAISIRHIGSLSRSDNLMPSLLALKSEPAL